MDGTDNSGEENDDDDNKPFCILEGKQYWDLYNTSTIISGISCCPFSVEDRVWKEHMVWLRCRLEVWKSSNKHRATVITLVDPGKNALSWGYVFFILQILYSDRMNYI